jgi:sugar lactone lactonase YvrE
VKQESPVKPVLRLTGECQVADSFNNRVQVFNSSGVYQTQFGSGGSGDGQFDTPFGIALDSSGNIYVVDSGNNRVQVFAPDAVVPEVPLKGETELLLVGVGGVFIWVMEKRKRERKKKVKL